MVGSGEPVRPRWWSALTGPVARMTGMVVLSALNAAAGVLASTNLASQAKLLGWPPPVWLAVASAVVAPFLLLWRRRAPLLILALTALAYLLSGIVVLPVGFALLTVAVRRRDLVLLACTAGVALTFWLSSESPDRWYVTLGLSVVFAAFWALWGSYVGARRDLLQSLRDRARRAEEEQLARADQARQTERARIAREMHDVVAHKVSLIALQAGGLEVNAQLAPDRVAGTAAQIRTTAREALEDLRSVLGVLRAGETDDGAGAELLPQPGLDDVPTLVDRSRAAGLAVTLVRESDDEPTPQGSDPGPPPFPVAPAAGRTAYRIVQEALTNVTKHARGATTTVLIGHRSSAPAAAVAIDGPVITVSVVNRRPVASGTLLPGSGAGLIGLRERVELVGGVLDTGPTGEGGWAVRAVLPAGAGDPIGTAATGVARGGPV